MLLTPETIDQIVLDCKADKVDQTSVNLGQTKLDRSKLEARRADIEYLLGQTYPAHYLKTKNFALDYFAWRIDEKDGSKVRTTWIRNNDKNLTHLKCLVVLAGELGLIKHIGDTTATIAGKVVKVPGFDMEPNGKGKRVKPIIHTERSLDD